jgi:hypothetical protein
MEHPVEKDESVSIGVSHEHRFAFYFWGRWLAAGKTSADSSPDLVTIDWHRDLASPSPQEKSDLETLNISNPNELSLFCWGYLNPHNDDHVLSAAYKNLIGDIYVLCKQKFSNPDQITDYEGNTHSIQVFERKQPLLQAIRQTQSIIWDLDLDYFTETDSFMGKDPDVEMAPDHEIRSLLDPDSDFLQAIFERMLGFTIALEPEFCGGYRNSCQLFEKVNKQLFAPPLLHPAGNWNFAK